MAPRRCLLVRFPHCMYYRFDDAGVIVVACLRFAPECHDRRVRG